MVEDEYFVGLEIEHHLVRAGFGVVGIASGADEAVELAERHRPNLVVMDVRLRGADDGVDAAIRIRERFGIASVFATAHSDPVTRQRAERAEPAGWLRKPYPQHELIAAVKAALNRS